MEPKMVALIAAIVAAGSGLLVGGLIGHFATKSKYVNEPKPTTDPRLLVNIPDPVTDNSNRQFLFDTISPEKIKTLSQEYSRKPHLAGSARNNELGNMVESTWKSYGFETRKEVYNVLLSYPGGPTQRNQAFIWNSSDLVEFESQKIEKVLVDNADPDEVVPPFNGYAKAGDVKRDSAYYVNYCRAEDFDHITGTMNINVSDSIVICRYGMIFRGNKVKLAQEYGAVGVLIYNDPEDSVNLDTNSATYAETFPNSWFLPPSGVERGSVMETSGDPLTLGFPAKEYALRKGVDQVREEKLIPNIPTQPIGYENAMEFLRCLGGAEVQEDWKGRLDGITYKYGGVLLDNKQFQITNYNTDERKDITNVFGIIKGSVEPDRYVLMGNHRDAWMNGAVDATSGTSVMMETSRVLSELMKTGWKPRRTIIFCSWDGEEYGIIGSIEWLDEVRVLLADRAVVYLNCDSGVVYNQYLKAGASPLLFNLMYETAKLVDIPGGKTLYQQWWEVTGNQSDPNSKPHISDLGSGSDHTGFYHRHGITSMDSVYYYDKKVMKVSAYYPLYHTSYDTFQAVEFVDSDFMYHKALTTFYTELTRNLADSVMIPYVVSDYATRLRQVFQSLNTAVRSKLAAKDPTLAESLDFLSIAIDKFTTEATKFDSEVSSIVEREPSWGEVRKVNDQLVALERAFLYPLGILTRKYIKHVVFAPSATDSYASAAFPGISDALYKIDQNDEPAWDLVKEELTKAVYTIESATKAITKDIII